MRTQARFPSVPPGEGHYESFYLKAAAPEGGRAVWIRHTIHKRPGADPTGAVWMTWFDRDRPGPVAAKQQVGPDLITTPAKTYVRVGESEIAPGRVQGLVADDGTHSSWNLRFTDHDGPLRHFPAEWMYERPLPRTKLLSPHPSASFDGIIDVAGERVNLESWPGMIGHNWGSEHAERWVWLEGTGFDGDPDAYFDAGAAKVKLGSRVSPWIPSGMLVLDGVAHRLGGLGAIRSARIEEQP